jgi:hypothetical protein
MYFTLEFNKAKSPDHSREGTVENVVIGYFICKIAESTGLK